MNKKENDGHFVIAVSGKGGTGKTTVAGLLIQRLVDRDLGSVLAIDADPNANLNKQLGLEVKATIGELEEEVLENPDKIPAGMTKKRWLEYNLQQLLVEGKGRDLLVMGRGEGPSCYCAINNILREYMDKLEENYDFVVMDNEAGMEHISRRTTSDIDLLLIVGDGNPVSIQSAERISRLVDELDLSVSEQFLVLNKFPDPIPEKTKELIEEIKLPLITKLPREEEILELCWQGKPLSYLEEDFSLWKNVDEILARTAPDFKKSETQT